MSVYVDPAAYPFGRMRMCHMLADTSAELMAMADAIGVARKWVQAPGTWREHFDVCAAKRTLAVQRGAVEVTSQWLAEWRARRRPRAAVVPIEALGLCRATQPRITIVRKV